MQGHHAPLEDLPPEVKYDIMRSLDPLDLVPLMLASRVLRDFVRQNETLYKQIYHIRLDEPPERSLASGMKWGERLQKYVRLRFALGSPETSARLDQKYGKLGVVCQIISELLAAAGPGKISKNVQLVASFFGEDPTMKRSPIGEEGSWWHIGQGHLNREAFLCRSTIFARAAKHWHLHPPTTTLQKQQSAKLHCFYGVPIQNPSNRYKSVYPYALSVVYDLRRYTEGTFWGPFMDDGKATIDWEKIEAIMIILNHNFADFKRRTDNDFGGVWTIPWHGATPDSFVPVSLKPNVQPDPPLNALDPYNITGSWMRIVCFLDFSELHAYNFANPDFPANEPRPPLDTVEAIRLIMMEVTVKEISPGRNGSKLPVVYFEGVSRSMHTSFDPNANSAIRGWVRETSEGEIRWTTFSIFGGREKWRSESVQIGGLRSERGVFGHWFDKYEKPPFLQV